MSFKTLSQLRVFNRGCELVLTPTRNSFSSSFDVDVCEEVCLAINPETYGTVIPFQAYGERKCRIIYKESDILEPLRIWQNTDYDFAIRVPAKLNEFSEMALDSGNPVFPFVSTEMTGFVTFNPPFACRQEGIHYVLTGRLNFKEFSGKADLSIQTAVCSLPLCVEVMTSKLSYEADYASLLKELSAIHAEIILKLDTPVSLDFGLDDVGHVSPHLLMIHLRRLFADERLPLSVSTILSNPNMRYRCNVKKELAAFVANPSLDSLASFPFLHDWNRGGSLKDTFNGFTPTTLPERDIHPNFNTIENKFVKYFLQKLMFLVEELIIAVPSIYTTSHRNLKAWHNLLCHWLSNATWNQVSTLSGPPNSMVLLQRTGYRELFFDYLCLDLSLRLEKATSELSTSGQLKPVWSLYQIWCYFQLYNILMEVTGSDSVPGIEHVFNNSIFNLSLKEGRQSKVSFAMPPSNGGVDTISLYCNRTFSKKYLSDNWSEVYSGFYHPDFSIEISRQGKSHWVHFDAKYKLEQKEWEQELMFSKDDVSVPVEHPNLDKVHSYRDAILGTRGSYILFPGNFGNVSIHVRHADPVYRDSFPGPSIGAYPLRPTSNTETRLQQKQNIAELLIQFIDKTNESTAYLEEEGYKL